ncbi:MAG TPA: hypothetical protein VKZ67_13290 [Natronosporangium sp.]|nr:hypothetical protein [Natronosporangium sp.]
MLSTPTYLAQEAPEGHDSPLRIWLDGWLVYLQDHLTTIFLLVVAVVGLVVLVRGGIKQTIFFIVGAGLVLLLLFNLDSVAEFFREELPLPDNTSLLPGGGPDPTPGSD